MIGMIFDRLLVLEYCGIINKLRAYKCRCQCGTVLIVQGSILRAGKKKSCGCLIRDLLILRNTKHGNKSRSVRSLEYNSWVSMNQRCYNIKHRHFKRYGGRGITVCDEWRKSFATFLDDMGKRPSSDHSLGRVYNNIGYMKSNCRWMTDREQSSSRITNNNIEINGEIKISSDWCEQYQISPGTFQARIRRGWDTIRALTTPTQKPWKRISKMSERSASEVGRSNVRRGKTHERRIAKILTDWSGVIFRRRRVEGRDVTTMERESASDVIPVKGHFLFSIEAKCGKGFSLDALLANPSKCVFTSWYHQASYDAQLVSSCLSRIFYPMVMFKPHSNWDWIAFSALAVPSMRHKNGIISPTLLFPHLYFDSFGTIGPVAGDVSHTKNKKIIDVKLDPVVFCRWNDFAENIDPTSCLF